MMNEAIIRKTEKGLWEIVIDGKPRKQQYLKKSDAVMYCRRQGLFYSVEDVE